MDEDQGCTNFLDAFQSFIFNALFLSSAAMETLFYMKAS